MVHSQQRSEEKLDKLYRMIAPYRKVVLAFSGGVDSTFLLYALKQDPLREILAVTARSATYPEYELHEAREVARNLGVPHIEIETDEMNLEAFRTNPPNRCYYCKRELFSKLDRIKVDHGFDIVMDGSNYDDMDDFRPGMQAGKELNVLSPLQACGLTKSEIRHLSRIVGLATWSKPSYACLSSRFPYGTEITEDALRQIDKCEAFLRKRIEGQVRVRYHGPVARIEVEPDSLTSIIRQRDEIVAFFTAIGFSYVTLDLKGYRTGSMNEVLSRQGQESDRSSEEASS